jgi:hypothetical protein
MLSESARMASAAEAKFRIDAPNSFARSVKVIALDAASERVVKRLAEAPWNQAAFLTASTFAAAPAPAQGQAFSMQGWLSDLAGRTKDLIDEVGTADLVVMIASSGGNAQAAGLIGEACAARRVMTTALIVGSDAAPDAALAKTLAQLRPHAMMLVIASADEYIADMLTALRA